MKTKTVSAASLLAFASLLEAKRTTAAAAAAAAKAAKVAAEALGLPAESVLLKSDDRSTEVAAIYTVRPVAAIRRFIGVFAGAAERAEGEGEAQQQAKGAHRGAHGDSRDLRKV
jgi:hypothetical protein